ncbi:hypothetical protein [Streptomyces phaeoluteigriseus]|uniref:hypothetical protein n=1 Tax=Streptomyces phaeoluteigriseus TaxID=114686 RepID=UPI000D1A8DC1|nr:hypothetical protein [Streptomyces phaeoluteigriseus]
MAHISPYLIEHMQRFGEYSTHELGIEPDACKTKLDVDFTPLREQEPSVTVSARSPETDCHGA